MSGYVAIAYGIILLVIGIGILIVKITEWCKECHEERQAEQQRQQQEHRQQQQQQSTRSANREGMAPSPFSDQVPMTSPPRQQQPINRTTTPRTTTTTSTTNRTNTTTRTNTSNILFTDTGLLGLHSKPTGTGPIIMSRSDLMSLDTIDLIQILKDRDVLHNDIYLKADYVHRILTMCTSSSSSVAAAASSSSGQRQQQQYSSVVAVQQLNDDSDDDLPSSPYYYDVEAPYSSQQPQQQQQQQQGFIHAGGSSSSAHPPPPPLTNNNNNNNASRKYQRQDSLNSYSRQTPSGVSQLVCGICNEPMGGNTDRPPAAPGCGHTFCHECLHRWISEKRLCPQCRSPSTVSDIRKLYNI